LRSPEGRLRSPEGRLRSPEGRLRSPEGRLRSPEGGTGEARKRLERKRLKRGLTEALNSWFAALLHKLKIGSLSWLNLRSSSRIDRWVPVKLLTNLLARLLHPAFT
jgi:hypothetical protein